MASPSDKEKLIRIEEQIKNIFKDIEDIKERIEKERDEARRIFATKEELAPLQRVIYTGVSFFFTAVFGGFITWLLRGGMTH